MLAGQVYVGCLFGQNRFALHAPWGLVLIAVVAGSSVVAFTLRYAPLELRLLLVFAFVLFCAGLARPLIAGPLPQWQLLAVDRGTRYCLLPTLAFAWSLAWCALQKQSIFFRVFASLALIAMLDGVLRDFRYISYADSHFQHSVNQYDQATVGQTIDVPIYPPGLFMRLKKKSIPSD